MTTPDDDDRSAVGAETPAVQCRSGRPSNNDEKKWCGEKSCGNSEKYETAGKSEKSSSSSSSGVLSYPPGVYFCLANEFLERFAMYGLQAVLTFYLLSSYDLGRRGALIAYHAFVGLSYGTSIVGSVWADGFVGARRVVAYSSVLYVVGLAMVTLSAVGSNGALGSLCGLIGLALTSLGAGARKPCLTALAADQFSESHFATPAAARRQRKQFFSALYVANYVSAVVAQLAAPTLRGAVACLNRTTCYPLAFGTLTLAAAAALLVFAAGSRFYAAQPPPASNVVADACRCVGCAVRRNAKEVAKKKKRRKNKQKSSTTNDYSTKSEENDGQKNQTHWLDSATPVYGRRFVDDLKLALRVCLTLSPTIVAWTLVFQSGSTFVVQGSAMNCRVGRFTVLPDALITSSSVFVAVLLIALESCIYPALARVGSGGVLQRPLQRIGLGCVLAVASFACAALVQVRIDGSEITGTATATGSATATGFVKLTVVNRATSCVVEVQPDDADGALRVEVSPDATETMFVPGARKGHPYAVRGCAGNSGNDTPSLLPPINDIVRVSRMDDDDENGAGGGAAEILVFWRGGGGGGAKNDTTSRVVVASGLSYLPRKTDDGNSRFYLLLHPEVEKNFSRRNFSFSYADDGPTYEISVQRSDSKNTVSPSSPFVDVKPAMVGSDALRVDLTLCRENIHGSKLVSSQCLESRLIFTTTTSTGSVDALLVDRNLDARLVRLVEPNRLNLLWQIPQYCLIVAADMFLSTGGVEFAYTQSAASMKSVLQSYRLVTLMIGNGLFMAVSSARLVDEPTPVFVFWTAVMAAATIVYALVAHRYEYVEVTNEEDDEDDENEECRKKLEKTDEKYAGVIGGKATNGELAVAVAVAVAGRDAELVTKL